MSEDRITVRVRGEDGSTRDDAWIETAEWPLRKRLRDAALLVAGGTLVGVLLLPIPLIHLMGIFFALACWGFAVSRLRVKTVLVAAGGACPRCGAPGNFTGGLTRARFRLPYTTSCPKCSVRLRLERPVIPSDHEPQSPAFPRVAVGALHGRT